MRIVLKSLPSNDLYGKNGHIISLVAWADESVLPSDLATAIADELKVAALPNTWFLLIVIEAPITASDFAAEWSRLCHSDETIRLFTGRLAMAKVLACGEQAKGGTGTEASLLDFVGPPHGSAAGTENGSR